MSTIKKAKALLVGISNYHSGKLDYVTDDINALADRLQTDNYRFEVDRFMALDITVNQLKAKIRGFFSQPADLYLFYFSGHGATTNLDTYFVTPDIENVDDGLPMDYLNKVMVTIPDKTSSVIIILDCCNAGAIDISGPPLTQSNINQVIYADTSNRVLIASCLENQASVTSSIKKRSLFTYYLLECLAGYSADYKGEIGIVRLYADISYWLKEEKLQEPLFQTRMSALTIGTGFKPYGTAPKNPQLEDEMIKIEQKSSERIEEINALLKNSNSPRNRNLWMEVEFTKAMQRLNEHVLWFQEKAEHSSNLLSDKPIFADNLEELIKARKRMAESIFEGVYTPRGVVKKRLGDGGFGTVWLIEAENGQKFAYKVCHPEVFNHDGKEKWFKNGYKANMRLENPNIVHVNQGDLTEAPLGFFMEYVDGKNWREWATENYDNFDEIIEQLLSLAGTVRYAHDNEVFHRDLKPENIMVTSDEFGKMKVMLTDFDLAWHSLQTTVHGSTSIASTYLYASPEFSSDPYQPSSRKPTTDIYSFGLLIYFAFVKDNTGNPEADTRRFEKAVEKHCNIGIVAEKLIGLYKDCTRNEPRNRIQTMDEVLEKLIEIRNLMSIKGNKLSLDKFLDDLAYSKLGVSRKVMERTFTIETIDRRYNLIISGSTASDKSSYANISIRCLAVDDIIVNNVNNYNRAREKIFIKLNQSLHSIDLKCKPDIRKGRDRPFEAFVNLSEVQLNSDGVGEAIKILRELQKALSSN